MEVRLLFELILLGLDPIPAEAHWQIGVVERAIRSLKVVMEAISKEFPQMSMDELVGRAVWQCNARDLYRGFSPLQHASGRTPDENMRLFDTVDMTSLKTEVSAKTSVSCVLLNRLLARNRPDRGFNELKPWVNAKLNILALVTWFTTGGNNRLVKPTTIFRRDGFLVLLESSLLRPVEILLAF